VTERIEFFEINCIHAFILFDIVDNFRKEVYPVAEPDFYSYLAQQAAYYFDFSIAQQHKLTSSPIDMAKLGYETRNRSAVFSDIILENNEGTISGMIESSNAEFTRIFLNHEYIKKIDNKGLPLFDVNAGFIVAGILPFLGFDVNPERLVKSLPPFDIRVSELALNLIYTVFMNDNSTVSTPQAFSAWAADEGYNVIVEKRKELTATLKRDVTVEDLTQKNETTE
jgi:hypothetical protein